MQRYSGVLLALGACLAGLVIALLVHEHAPGHRRHTRGGAPGDPSLTSIHDIGTMMRIMRYLEQEDLARLSRVDRHNRDMVQIARGLTDPRVYDFNHNEIFGFSPDGQKVVCGTHKGDEHYRLIVRTLSQSTEQPVVLEHPGESEIFGRPQFSPDGQTVAYWTEDGRAHMFDSNTGRNTHQINEHRGGTRIAFNPNGTHIALGCDGESLSIYWFGPQTAPFLEWTFRFKMYFHGLSYSANGTRLLVQGALEDDAVDTLFIWDATRYDDPRLVYKETNDDYAVLSPNGKILLTYGDGGMRVRHEEEHPDETGEKIYTDEFHQDPSNHMSRFTKAAFSPDMLTIVTGTNTGELSVWKVAGSRVELSQTVNLGGYIEIIEFSTSGDLLNVAAGTKCFQYTTPLVLPPQERIGQYIDS